MCVSGDLFSPHSSLTPVVLVVMSMTLAVVVVEVFPAVLHSQHSEFLVHSLLLVSYLLTTLFSILTSGVTLFVARSSISVYFIFPLHVIFLFLLKHLEHLDSSTIMPLSTKSISLPSQWIFF